MAEPSTRRPQIVEEELKVAAIEIPKKKISLFEVFMCDLGNWYTKNLKPEEKAKLTTKQFKRRAVAILEKYRYPYTSLPKDWVGTAIERYGIQLYEKQKKPRKPAVEEEETPEVKFVVDPMNVFPGMHGATLAGVAVKGKIVSSVKMETEEGDDPNNEDDNEAGAFSGNQPKMPARKKLVDLTDLPPPIEWVSAHAAGIYLPRELTIYSGDAQNFMFYDYSPKSKCNDPLKNPSGVPCRSEGRVHNRNNFSWISNAMKKEGEAEDDEKCMDTSEKLLEHASENAVHSFVGEDSVVSSSPPIQIPSTSTSTTSNQDYEAQDTEMQEQDSLPPPIPIPAQTILQTLQEPTPTSAPQDEQAL